MGSEKWSAVFFPSSSPVPSGAIMTDKVMVFQVDIDATAQDDWDMQRLGKTQQLKVGVPIGYQYIRKSGHPTDLSDREISVFTPS